MLFLQTLINGILLGGIYALYSAGFSLIFGVLNVVNIAHGEFVMLGAFTTYWMFDILALDPFITLPFSLIALILLGYLLQRFILNWVVEAPPIMSYIMTFGIHLVLANVALLAWTADPRMITTSYSGANFNIGGIIVPYSKLITFMISVGVVSGLYRLLHHSRTGRAIQATAQDREMARLMGIKVRQIYAITFALGAGITGMAGSLVASFRPVDPGMGMSYTLTAFCVVVLGGMGYMPGAMIGGLLLGVISSLSTLVFTSGWSVSITFFLLFLMLLFRPAGITGKGIVE